MSHCGVLAGREKNARAGSNTTPRTPTFLKQNGSMDAVVVIKSHKWAKMKGSAARPGKSSTRHMSHNTLVIRQSR